MKFHFCREGESLLSIARDEGASPVRLLEDNSLSDPDRLAVGQCLAIYTPSRLYTVRGGDTLRALCIRLGTDELTLRKFNPSIGERGILYPGQSLALARGEPPIGAISTLGLASSATSLSILRGFASALTYLAIFPTKSDLRSGFSISKCDSVSSFAVQNGVLPLLAVPISALSRELLLKIKERSYAGVFLEGAGDGAALSSAADTARHLGLIVICRPIGAEISNIRTDLIVRSCKEGEAFSEACRSVLDSAELTEHAAMIEIPSRALVNPRGVRESSPTQRDCAAIAYRRNRPILRDGDGRPYFRFTRTKHGVTEQHILAFEDLASIRKGLTVLGESSFAGIVMNVEELSPAVATLISHSFDVIRA